MLVAVAALACTGGDGGGARRDEARPGRPDDRPLPPPVEVRAEPEGVTLADPAFEPLPGARADFGRLGGAVYQIEMPDEWNGQLVLWMHGFSDFAAEVSASAPDIRAHLVAQGYAWGGSSFSSSSWIPGRAADETAALWDHFVRTHGRPDRTYVIGLSMGGAAGHIAAERYPDRFDGVLALCGSAGATPALTDGTNMFVAAAFAAGVTQAELDASPDIPALIRDRIRPALRDLRRRNRFERLMVDLTGGLRPYDREGIRNDEETNWRRLEVAVAAGVVPRREEPYRLGRASDVSAAEFNRAAVRLRTDDELLRNFVTGNEVTGRLEVPLLTMHSAGDAQVPIEQARILRRRVDAAGRNALLVQRVIRDPGHCGFTGPEWAAGFEALVDWVEHQATPEGHDVLTAQLDELHPAYELQPRAGMPEADTVPGADDRIVLRGTATVDGAPFDARWLGAVVQDHGLQTPCQYGLSAVSGGQFEVTVLAATEAHGCGTRGAEIVLWAYVDGVQLHSTGTVPWPETQQTTEVQVNFSTASPRGVASEASEFVGEVLDSDGRYAPPGTRIVAHVGEVLCGIASTRGTGSFSGYSLSVVGPDAVPGCRRGATLQFRVDDVPVPQAATHQPGQTTHGFDLLVR